MKNDNLILSFLRQDARVSLTQMSRKTSIPISTLYERLKAYKKSYIKKNTAILDFDNLGYSARAKVLLKVNKKQKEDLREFLVKCQHINELVKVNNGYDFFVEFIFQNMKELEGYLEGLGNKFDIDEKVFYVVDELKKESFMSNPLVEQIGKSYK
jgi:DNA-binding Lrp family transcriptional regulator